MSNTFRLPLFKAKVISEDRYVSGDLIYSIFESCHQIKTTHDVAPSMSDPCGSMESEFNNIDLDTLQASFNGENWYTMNQLKEAIEMYNKMEGGFSV